MKFLNNETLASENFLTRKFPTRKFLDTKIFGFTVIFIAVIAKQVQHLAQTCYQVLSH